MYKISNALQYPWICLKPITVIVKPDMSIDTKSSWSDFLIHFLQYWKHITLACKKYNKFIEELVGFINDLSITYRICYTSFWKIVSLLKNLWFRWALCVSYITKLIAIVLMNINKAIVESLWHDNLTQGTIKNIPWAFFQEHTHPLTETCSRGSCNWQEFDLDNLFYF